jgi:hypothetical protein
MTDTTNFDLLIQTVNSFRYSQGFYSRLARDLEEMDSEQKEELKNHVNSLEKWNGQLDVVLWLEQ